MKITKLIYQQKSSTNRENLIKHLNEKKKDIFFFNYCGIRTKGLLSVIVFVQLVA